MSGKAILCDLDGTLVDSCDDLTDAVNVARACCMLAPLPATVVAGYIGNGMKKLMQRSLPGVDGDTFAEASARFMDHYREHCCERTRPYDGVVAALQELHGRGWRLGVVTNKPTDLAVRVLQGTGFAELFAVAAVCGGDQLRKPDPAPLHRVLAILAADAAGSWMVGDHDTDLRAGRAAGCRVAFCEWGIGHRDGGPVDAVLARPADLLRSIV